MIYCLLGPYTQEVPIWELPAPSFSAYQESKPFPMTPPRQKITTWLAHKESKQSSKEKVWTWSNKKCASFTENLSEVPPSPTFNQLTLPLSKVTPNFCKKFIKPAPVPDLLQAPSTSYSLSHAIENKSRKEMHNGASFPHQWSSRNLTLLPLPMTNFRLFPTQSASFIISFQKPTPKAPVGKLDLHPRPSTPYFEERTLFWALSSVCQIF